MHLRGKKNSASLLSTVAIPQSQATSTYVGIGLAIADGAARLPPKRVVLLTTSSSKMLLFGHLEVPCAQGLTSPSPAS